MGDPPIVSTFNAACSIPRPWTSGPAGLARTLSQVGSPYRDRGLSRGTPTPRPFRGARPPRAVAERLIDPHTSFERTRLAYRDVASATNRVTLIAALLPRHTLSTHTVFCLKAPIPVGDQWCLLALLNSLVANFLVRLHVTTHVTASLMASLPVPRPARGSSAFRDLAAIA